MNRDFISGVIMDDIKKRARGRQNAIVRDVILRHVQLFDNGLTDDSLRKIYRWLPICSTSANPPGLFIPETEDELARFLVEYEKHVGPKKAAVKRSILYAAYPHLVPAAGKQMELF